MITRFATTINRLALAFTLLFTIAACGGGNGGGGFFPDEVIEPVTIITTGLPSAQDGIAYVSIIEADGGKKPYSWTVVDDGETGLTINNEGVLAGIPPKVGDYGITLQVRGNTSTADRASFVLTVSGDTPQALAVATAPDGLPAAEERKAYLALLEAVGGDGDYQWTLVNAGNSGLQLRDDGLLSGTAPAKGQYAITVSVIDGTGIATASATLILTVTAQSSPLEITTSSLSQATVDERFATVLTASGGEKPYNWTLVSDGGLSGLSLSTGGVLAGTPTQPGIFVLKFSVSDGLTTSQSDIPLEVVTAGGGGEPQITTTSLPEIGSSNYVAIVEATGGKPPYNWDGRDETTPSTGFTVAPSTGVISGETTTIAPGSYGYNVTVTDSEGVSASRAYIIVKP